MDPRVAQVLAASAESCRACRVARDLTERLWLLHATNVSCANQSDNVTAIRALTPSVEDRKDPA